MIKTAALPPRRAALLLAAALCALLAPQPAPAQSGPTGDAARGRAFAQKTCGNCHAIGRTGASRHKDAPTFRRIATKYRPDDLVEAFAEGIMVGHNASDMPEFELEPREIDDLVAWLSRLRSRKN